MNFYPRLLNQVSFFSTVVSKGYIFQFIDFTEIEGKKTDYVNFLFLLKIIYISSQVHSSKQIFKWSYRGIKWKVKHFQYILLCNYTPSLL